MFLERLILATLLVGAALAQVNITQALSGQPDLSTLTTFIGQFPQLLTTLGNANNITLLAPSNDALSKFISNAGTNLANDTNLLQATLYVLYTW